MHLIIILEIWVPKYLIVVPIKLCINFEKASSLKATLLSQHLSLRNVKYTFNHGWAKQSTQDAIAGKSRKDTENWAAVDNSGNTTGEIKKIETKKIYTVNCDSLDRWGSPGDPGLSFVNDQSFQTVMTIGPPRKLKRCLSWSPSWIGKDLAFRFWW